MSTRALHAILTTDPRLLHEFQDSVDGWGRSHVRGSRADAFEVCCSQDDARVSIVPRNSHREGDVSAHAGCLWARLETKAHADALSRFRRGPTLVVREGKSPRRWALWWLAQPLTLDVVARGNRAIAFTLGTVQKYGSEPETAFLPCPGSMMKLGRKTPMPVAVEYADSRRRYRPGDFRGVVKKPPEVSTSWRKMVA